MYNTRIMLLINPPISKSCQAPAGLACLAGFLNAANYPCTVWDASIDAVHFGFKNAHTATKAKNVWENRVLKNHHRNLETLRRQSTYKTPGRYIKTVNELTKLLEMGTENTAQPANFKHPHLAPVNSQHIKQAATDFETNPFYKLFKRRLPGLLEKNQDRHVGISVGFLSQALCAAALCGYLRAKFPEVTISLGGGLINSWMSNPNCKNPFAGFADHIISGKGENTLAKILGLEPGKIPAHTLPDFSGFEFEKYLSPVPVLPYSASRGCFWNKCRFCPERAEKSVWEQTPPQQVIEDITKLKQQFPFGLTHLLDNAISPALLHALASARNIGNWYGFTRFLPQLEDEGFCRQLAHSGCVMLQLGLESGSQSVLDQMQKGVVLENASKILENLHKAGIATYVYLLFGTPAETREQALKTMQYTADHSGYIDFLNLAIFNLPLFSPLSADLKQNHFYEGDLALYTDFEHPNGWNRRQVREFVEKEFKKHPAIAPIIQNDPPVFTSNHAPFFSKSFKW